MNPAELREKAERYRRMALHLIDPRTVEALNELAQQYNEVASKLEKRNGTPALEEEE